MRLIDLHREQKARQDAARWWRELGNTYDDFSVYPAKAATARIERERCFLFDCVNTNLARIAELDIQSALAQAAGGLS